MSPSDSEQVRFKEDVSYRNRTDYETKESRQAAADCLESIEKLMMYSIANQETPMQTSLKFRCYFTTETHMEL
ncbi:hypothetical protein SeMB42_g02642 [Synchytrium endobioticum]|uniref:Uncharacterized protein n=1 Tax=Synchytrium endobioticum TaxID=286115 RepID=A0A507DCB7_9FUNG|nr:hypothetical protein SeMB42_g02642 [Synchytrium endobioticum]